MYLHPLVYIFSQPSDINQFIVTVLNLGCHIKWPDNGENCHDLIHQDLGWLLSLAISYDVVSLNKII